MITVSVSWNSSLINGSLVTNWRSTLKPTPVPFINTYKSSSNARRLSTAIYEQLYPETFSLFNASPAVIKQRIEGITSKSKTAFFIGSIALSVKLKSHCSFKCPLKKLKYLFTVSFHVSRLLSSYRYRAYLDKCIYS